MNPLKSDMFSSMDQKRPDQNIYFERIRILYFRLKRINMEQPQKITFKVVGKVNNVLNLAFTTV